MRWFLRYLMKFIKTDLEKSKMVFIGGPRQVGKTTLALEFLKHSPKVSPEKHPAYLNWDYPPSRSNILDLKLPLDQEIIIFDEIHKYARWRNLIKGIYDTHKSDNKFIVTGSAKLDHFRKGGDSLMGRYHYYRLHPMTYSEFDGNLDDLFTFGGFPEPLHTGSVTFWRRWQKERMSKVVYEDLQSLERVKEVSLIDVLVHALPERVGSPLSIQSLRENLDVAHESVERWISILESLYVVFRIPPFGSPKIRAVKKEQKLYFWDWSQVESKGFRFENLVASHLLKYCHFIEDTEGFNMELRFIRDTDGREIDFVVLKDKKPLFAVECKSGDRQLSSHIEYFKNRTNIPEFYQVHLNEKDFGSAKTGRVLPFKKFCKVVGLV